MLEDTTEKGRQPSAVALGSAQAFDTWWVTVLWKAESSGRSVVGEFVKGAHEWPAPSKICYRRTGLRIYGAAGFSHPAVQCVWENRATSAAMERKEARKRKKGKHETWRTCIFGNIFKRC